MKYMPNKVVTYKNMLIVIGVILLSSCKTLPAKDDRMKPEGHVDGNAPAAVKEEQISIPPVVTSLPVLTPPKPAEKLQTFTVVVADVPANELLFALARDARLNLDIDPKVDGRVSINAIDQTLPQILNRISRQVNLRYFMDGPNLVVEVDKPFSRIYSIDYLNMSRTSQSSIALSTQIAATGSVGNVSGGNDSSTNITNQSDNKFWESLEANITSMVSGSAGGSIISNRETGVISVLATSKDHEKVQNFLDKVMKSARQQVLIEATVVEVTLNDDFQAGVDWAQLAGGDGLGNGWSFASGLASLNPGAALTSSEPLIATYKGPEVSASIKALDAFGEVAVMSSPKIMTLNNQTSILKVVDNTVYFTTEQEETTNDSGVVTKSVFTTTINTVPVGFVMNVTPFITDSGEIILNVRPTISRIVRYVKDPNPALTIDNNIPEIQVREMESILRVADGNTAVIGGLMQDSSDEGRSGLPGLSESEGFGFLFGEKSRNLDKTELVIFLRPRIINRANINGELSDFKRFLKPRVFSE